MIKSKEDLINFLIEEYDYSKEDLDTFSDRDLFDKYLKYEGIIGFTDEIIEIVSFLNFDE